MASSVYPLAIDGTTYEVTVSSGVAVAGSDTTAIHDDTAAEISAVTEKATPVDADLILIEDSADSNAKKRIQIGNIPAKTIGIATVSSATHTVASGEDIIHVTYTATGVVTVTLPTSETTAGRIIDIKDAGLNAITYNITVVTEGSELIEGSATLTLNANGSAVTLYSDGTNWFIY